METNNINDSAAHSLANLFRHNSTLKDLYLGYNLFVNQGIEIIENKLDDTSINTIYKIINNNQK